MSFLETVGRARSFLERQRRVSLCALRREFELDAEALAELRDELVEGQRVAVVEGDVLIWMSGEARGSGGREGNRRPPLLHPQAPGRGSAGRSSADGADR